MTFAVSKDDSVLDDVGPVLCLIPLKVYRRLYAHCSTIRKSAWMRDGPASALSRSAREAGSRIHGGATHRRQPIQSNDDTSAAQVHSVLRRIP